MKAVFVDQHGSVKTKEISSYPPIGARCFMGSMPLGYVREIILFPDEIEGFGLKKETEEAVKGAEILVRVEYR